MQELINISVAEIPSVLAHLSDKYEQLERSFEEFKEAQAAPTINPYERLTINDIVSQYRISKGTIHNLKRNGRLPYEKVGRKTIFKREHIERAIKKG